MIKVTGRVINVRLSEDSASFTVTLGPPPNLFWFRSVGKPPKLGQLVRAFGEVRTKQLVGAGESAGSITELLCEHYEIDTTVAPVRVVPQVWHQRVQDTMRRKLYPYQVEGAAWLCSRWINGVGSILADEMGIGKSAQTVAALCAVQLYPALIICPASLKPHWAREFRWAKSPPRISIISGIRNPIAEADVYIINFDILYKREPELIAIKPRAIVIDEAQELKHPTARGSHRAAAATRIVRQQMIGAVELTGTPIMNRPEEYWRLLHLAEPKTWPRFGEFRARYLQAKKGEEVGRSIRTGAGKVERLTELQISVDQVMLRRLKSQVLKDLPPKERRSILVRIDDESLRHYRAAEKDVVAWLQALGKNDRAIAAKKAEGIVKVQMLRRIAAIGKLRSAVPAYLQSWFSTHREPLVIFGYHRDVMVHLLSICRALRLRTAGIGGGESPEKRQRQVDAFQAGQADVFLAPIKSAGVGLNLQRASEALFVERLFTPSGMLQAEDRVYRIGQDRPVTITYLDAAGTVDEDIAHILEEKQRLIRAVVDDNEQGSESLETVETLLQNLGKYQDPEYEQ